MKIFVSYSRKDAGDFAEIIRDNFTSIKHDVFTDIDSISGGDIWNKTIEDNISKCEIFVVIITSSALLSPHVENEVLQAQTEKKRIIPCFHKMSRAREVKWGLNKIQGVEFDGKFELARELYSMIERDENKISLNMNVESSSHLIQQYLDKARDFEDIKSYDKALEQYVRAIENEPSNFLAIYSKSLLLYRIGRFNESLEAIEHAIALRPKNTDVWYHKACILEKLERYEESLEALRVDLRIDPKDINSWMGKAKILDKMQKYEEELEVLDELISIDSTNIDALEKKIKILKILRPHSKSIENKVAEINDKIRELQKESQVKKIFISYSRIDGTDIAHRIFSYLAQWEYNVFSDYNVNFEVLNDTTEGKISACDVFVVILTFDAIKSLQIEKEVLQAQQMSKKIIPCIYEGMEKNDLKWGLEKFQPVEFSDSFELARKLSSTLEILKRP